MYNQAKKSTTKNPFINTRVLIIILTRQGADECVDDDVALLVSVTAKTIRTYMIYIS
jgi:hypothetical protein